MNSKIRLPILLLASSLVGTAPAATLFSSDFDGNTGATVLAGNTDNTIGSSTVTITDWTLDPSVTAISDLTAITTNDGGTSSAGGGFAQLQNGAATYANGDNLFLNPNHNTDASRADNYRGFSLSFTLDAPWDLATLTVLSAHTTNTGNQDQAFTSDLVFNLSGGTLGAPVGGSSPEDYAVGPDYHTVGFDLTGTTLGAGSYTLEVYQANMPGGGAYASFDGISLESIPEPSTVLLSGLAGLALLARRRR